MQPIACVRDHLPSDDRGVSDIIEMPIFICAARYGCPVIDSVNLICVGYVC